MKRAAMAMLALGGSSVALAEAAQRAASQGVYTVAQAARGRSTYMARCAACHGAALAGADVSPPLAGGAFTGNWTGQSVDALVQRIRTTMPQDAPGTLGGAATADVVAHLLATNGFAPGIEELPSDRPSQQQITIDRATTGP